MQIISGKWRGRKLHLPPNARPTQNKARIALFNILTPLIDSSRPFVVWDAFAGSGAFGLEFMSRYDNAEVIFTDKSLESFKVIGKNSRDSFVRMEMTDTLKAINRHGARADIIFIDPPYADANLGAEFVKKTAPLLKPGAIIIWEMDKNFTPDELPKNLKIIKDKTYSRARFLFLSIPPTIKFS